MMSLVRCALCALVSMSLVLTACKNDQGAAPKDEASTTQEVKKDGEEKPAEQKPAADAGEPGSAEADGQGNQWVKSALYGVKFRVPEDWEVSIDAEGITATDSDETTTIILVGSESTGMIQAALNDIKKKVAFKDAKLDKTDMVVINGMAGQIVRGSAVIEKGNAEANADQEIQFIAYNLSVGKKAVTMMVFSQAEMYEAKKEVIEAIGQTLTKN